MKRLTVAAVLALVIGTACSESEDGKGTVTFTTWGEEYIEQEIPASEFADGWSVKFTKFLVVIGDVSVAEEGKAAAVTMPTPKLFDVHAPGQKPVVTFTDVPSKAYRHVSYAVVPGTAAVELGGGATEADKQLMVQNGYSIYFEATATKAATTKSMSWGFKTSTLYDRCKGEVSGKETDGVVVTNGGTDAVELTIHGDHFFYDDLQAPEAALRFDSLAAADSDNDGKITPEELAAVDLADRTKITAGPYGTGSASNINDLRAFVEALSRTVGHFRGEGECLARAR